MAPEQLEASPDVDARADQYAFGVMLFEMVTGTLPFTGPSPYAIAAARLMQPPPDPRSVRPDLPDAIATVIMRCMARKPEDRFAKIEEIAVRLGSATLPAISMAPPTAPHSHTSIVDTGAKTLAVLPLRNAGNEADDYIAEGLTDDLIDGLSMTAGLRVRPRSAVMHLRGQSRDPRDVGRELGVQVVAEGSVRVTGDAARITVRLVSVVDGFQLWAKRFDVSKGDVLRAADEAATAIAEALTVERKDVRPVVTDAAAVDLYLRARHEYYKFEFDANDRAVMLFEQALAIRSDDPLILSGAAMAMARTSQFRDANPELFARSRVHAQRALALAPDLAEPLVAMAMVDLHSGNAPSAAHHVRQALKRSANLADAHDIAARLLIETGPKDAFDRHCDRALALEPRIQMLRYFRVRWASFDQDTEAVDRALAVPPPDHLRATYWQVRFRLLLWSRDSAQAKILAARTDVQYPPFIVPLMNALVTGEFDPAAVADVEARAIGASTPRAAGLFSQIAAEIHAFARNYGRSFEFMRRAADASVFDIVWLERCPLFEPVRKMPGYEEIRAQIESRAAKIRDELV
jgi:serine/threonine-protein kinase